MILRWLKFMIKLFSTLILIYIIAAVLFSFIPVNRQEIICHNKLEVFVQSNGIHVDIIIPFTQLEKEFRDQLSLPTSTQFVAFGWGDRSFYLNTPTWSDLTLSTAFHALFWESASVMHVTTYKLNLKNWQKIVLCPEQLSILLHYITTSFKRDSANNFINIKNTSYGLTDKFFEANRSYNCFYTCNTWVVNAFHEASVTTALWSPFDFGILYHLPD
ncbi:MAG: TIGR02117 family protein, partial [Bacteroidota bacterium]